VQSINTANPTRSCSPRTEAHFCSKSKFDKISQKHIKETDTTDSHAKQKTNITIIDGLTSPERKGSASRINHLVYENETDQDMSGSLHHLDVIDSTNLELRAAAENSSGKPFFFINLKLLDRTSGPHYAKTSATNLYNNIKTYKSILASPNFTLEAAEVYIRLELNDRPSKIGLLEDFLTEDHFMTTEKTSVFLLNSSSRSLESNIAAGYIAAMLTHGFFLPKSPEAAARLIRLTQATGANIALSPALSLIAELGTTTDFLSWVDKGADIMTALKYGYDPLADAVVNEKWSTCEAILSIAGIHYPQTQLLNYAQAVGSDGQTELAEAFKRLSEQKR
jgi:hypothetical protein